jgi:hypothetical protein
MGATNYGNQVCTVGFNAPALAISWNRRSIGVIQPGIYYGGYLSVGAPNTVHVDTLGCEIRDATYQVKIQTQSPVDLFLGATPDITKPYVVLRWAYAASLTNYMDVVMVAVGDVQANDIVLGMCIFTSGNLTSFVYDDATFSRTTPNDVNVFLRAEAELTPTALKVIVRAGRTKLASGNGTKKIYDTVLTLTTASSSAIRYDLIYVDDTGAHVFTGTAGSGIPSYAGKKVVAEVTVGISATVITQADIKDVRCFIG